MTSYTKTNNDVLAGNVPIKPPTYKRQQFLLSLIKHLKNKVTATDLQKVVFLYTMESGMNYYDFVPYKYGAYSFQLAQDIEVLCKDGYMTAENRLVEPERYSFAIEINVSAIEKSRGNLLIRKVYERYPYYAIRSEIAEKVLDRVALQTVRAVNRQLVKTEQVLFSIGYEGKSIETFVNILLKNDIRLLCDVRRNPISRKFGFSQGKLQHIVESVGILYVHIPELGIDSTERQSLETQADYSALFAKYEKTLSSKTKALKHTYSLLKSNVRIALMCYEQDPNCCHRTVIKNYLVEHYHTKSEDL